MPAQIIDAIILPNVNIEESCVSVWAAAGRYMNGCLVCTEQDSSIVTAEALPH